MGQQLTQGRIGHLEFGTPGTDIIVTAQKAIQTLITKHVGVTPAIMVVNGQYHARRAEFEALGIVQIIFGSTQPHMCWVGAEKVKSPARSSGRTAVRVIESSRARVLAAVDLPSPPVVETVITLPPVVIETPISTALCRAMIGVPALPAPKIAGLLLPRNPTTEPETDEDEGEEPIAVVLPWLSPDESAVPDSARRVERIRAMLERQAADALPRQGCLNLYTSRGAMIADRDLRASTQAVESMIALCELYGDASGEMAFSERGFRLLIASGPVKPAPMLPQEVTMHPRDVMRELADQKSQPNVLSIAARLEKVAQDRALVEHDKVKDFLEALEFAVSHRDDAQAQLLMDGHRFMKHGKQGHIKVKHPSLKVEPMLVAVQLHRQDGYRFVARPHEVRAYLEKCEREFEAKKIARISAGELYPGEVEKAA